MALQGEWNECCTLREHIPSECCKLNRKGTISFLQL